MDKFKKYAEILKNFSKDMEMWKACEEDEIADAKEKYTSKALPEQLEKIKSVYEKRYKKVRQIALEQVESETKSIKQRNQGKFKPDFVDLELLKELNAISAAGIPMTESEVEAYCIGIRAKDDVSSSLAARYAKAYSERMSTVNPEFE